MHEKLSWLMSALDPLLHALNNKVTNLSIAGGVLIASQTAKEASGSAYKTLAEIPVGEILSHELSTAAACQLIATAYIIMQAIPMLYKFYCWCGKKLKGEK